MHSPIAAAVCKTFVDNGHRFNSASTIPNYGDFFYHPQLRLSAHGRGVTMDGWRYLTNVLAHTCEFLKTSRETCKLGPTLERISTKAPATWIELCTWPKTEEQQLLPGQCIPESNTCAYLVFSQDDLNKIYIEICFRGWVDVSYSHSNGNIFLLDQPTNYLLLQQRRFLQVFLIQQIKRVKLWPVEISQHIRHCKNNQ